MEVNKILNGDAIQHLKKLPENSVDAIITDPPYGLEFMGKEWDIFTGSDTGIIAKPTSTYSEKGFHKLPIFRGFTKEQINQYQEFSYLWAKECLRVLKHGGYLLSFGGTRTYHRMVCGIEDAGFEIRDTIMWLYGSGFPKSLNIGKQIDKIQGNKREVIGQYIAPDGNPRGIDFGIQGGSFAKGDGKYIKEKIITKGYSEWEGWGTALKPACEPIVLARKPLKESSIAMNVIKYGVGGLNIDECRIEHNEEMKVTKRKGREDALVMNNESCGFNNTKNTMASADPKGRFPANIILDEKSADILDEQSGILKSGAMKSGMGGFGNANAEVYGKSNGAKDSQSYKSSIGGASRFFYVVKANKKERDLGCDALQEKPMRYEDNSSKSLEIFSNQYTESSGNPTGRGKTTPKRNNHPTVKPIKLMEYLIKLITKEGQIVLDPFLGSGTTAIACVNLKRNWIGIEREPDYIEIAQARINHFSKQKKLGEENE